MLFAHEPRAGPMGSAKANEVLCFDEVSRLVNGKRLILRKCGTGFSAGTGRFVRIRAGSILPQARHRMGRLRYFPSRGKV